MALPTYCQACGRRIPPGHSYCGKCGSPSAKPASSTSSQEWTERSRKFSQYCEKCKTSIPANLERCLKCSPSTYKQAIKIVLAIAMLLFGVWAYLNSR
jgi:hypothetical protein